MGTPGMKEGGSFLMSHVFFAIRDLVGARPPATTNVPVITIAVLNRSLRSRLIVRDQIKRELTEPRPKEAVQRPASSQDLACIEIAGTAY